MATVPSIHVCVPKVGNFYFLTHEFESYRELSRAALIDVLAMDFAGGLTRAQITCLADHMLILLST